MEKCIKIIFYTFLGILCFGTIYLTTMMYLSPRRDIQRRGFIPCTEQLVFDLQTCNAGSLGCPFKFLVRDTGCNIGVVYTGAVAWIKGRQPTPWANYLFEPEVYADDALTEDMPTVAEAREEMSDLAAQSRFIEQKQQELEKAKHRQLQINQDVLLSNPENPQPTPVVKPQKSVEEDVPQGDISDEANIKITAPKQENTGKTVAPNEPNILQKIQKQTDEKITERKFEK